MLQRDSKKVVSTGRLSRKESLAPRLTFLRSIVFRGSGPKSPLGFSGHFLVAMRAGRDLTMDVRLAMFASDPIALEQKGEENPERAEDKTKNESGLGPVLPTADYSRSNYGEYPDEKEFYHSFTP